MESLKMMSPGFLAHLLMLEWDLCMMQMIIETLELYTFPDALKRMDLKQSRAPGNTGLLSLGRGEEPESKPKRSRS